MALRGKRRDSRNVFVVTHGCGWESRTVASIEIRASHRLLVASSFYPPTHQHPQPYHGRSVRAQLSRTPGSHTGTRRCRVEVRITPVHQGLRRIAVKHRYDMRHQCQEILPGLLLGPFQVSKNQGTLNELGISHMYASCSEFLHTTLRSSPWTASCPESAFAM
jgi:hypothetical protein